MGWLNAAARVTALRPFDLDALLVRSTTLLREAFAVEGVEAGHLKTIGLHQGTFGVANLVSCRQAPELSLPARNRLTEAEVIVNARAAADPAWLEAAVRRAVTTACHEAGAAAAFRSVQSFRPGRPQPTHRYAVAK
jgi:hypothetical protein